MAEDTDTLVSLRDFFQRMHDDHCKLNEARFKSLETAVDKASEVMNIRLASMNEFREAMKDQASRFITLERVEAIVNVWNGRMQRLEEAVQLQATKLVTQDRYEVQHQALIDRIIKLEKAQVVSDATAATLKIIVGALVAILVAVIVGLVTGELHLGKVIPQ
jgi:hypothetical protein